jgi:hypothetical protein
MQFPADRGRQLKMIRATIFATTLAAFLGAAIPLAAQFPVPPPSPEAAPQSPPELDQLLGPIALYPDPLIAQILPAATLPAEVVLAYRYVSGGGDLNWIDQQPWDTSVKALARYPDVLKMMNDNLAWTTDLGQAFLSQPQDVMNSIQDLRAQAQDLGNLQSSQEEDVVDDDGTIDIVPDDPDMLFVPIYQPNLVFFQRPYGGRFVSFGAGMRTGAWLDHDFDWHDHNILVWNHDHPRPNGWWKQRPSQRPGTVANSATVWRPAGHPPTAAASGEDRGWNPRGTHAVYTASPRVAARPAEPQKPIVIHNNSAPGPGGGRQIEVPHHQDKTATEPATRPPPSNGALIGAQSTRETRAASSRGQQSRQTMSHPAPAAPHAASPGSSSKKTR